ncbi:putative two component transcriptional regulator, sensor histidine kinase [Variovorax paradoxus B4]|uniref:histidine kinase n=2 Tax=Variovorax paradoxus TaxID=34073 RepID=A0A0H2M8G4_VARPD|nr:sensor histidine kinase [Variovorax paradoxus]AGU50276.1 putative two component transcriptional regulator, sensor histidine kinase [Variovorax paradoxus B4]KLN58794.1 sensor protein QseC [Variovorax paradoxus]
MDPRAPAPPPRPEPQRFGIRARLLALLVPGIVALMALDSWSDYQALTDSLVVAYDQSLLEPVRALANGIVVASDGSVKVQEPFSVQAMFESTHLRYKYLHVGVQRIASGEPLDTSSPETTLMGVPGLPRPAQRPADGTPVFYDAVYEQHPVRVAALRQTVYDNTGSGAAWSVLVQAAEGTGPRRQAQAESLKQELLRDVRMILVMALLVWLGVAWTLRPLERLRRSLRDRPRDDLKPLDAGGVPQEVVPLVEAVNHHIADHRRMVAEHSQFLADASHQLRTPLSILSIQAGYAVRETDPARMRESLHAIVAQLARTRRLSEQLLALAHATNEDEIAAAEPEVVDLGDVARAVVLQYLPLARENEQDLGWVDARGEPQPQGEIPALPVRANAAELHEVLANLVHNAIKYTPRGGSITVTVRREASHALAEVCDSGPGIDPERRDSVFERFHRDPAAGSAASQGAGLGLTIARSYARRNGGEIALDNADMPERPNGGGLRAILKLPLAVLPRVSAG